MHYYPFHLKDYVAATAHLTPLEDICYRRLLDLAYETEAPLDEDIDALARRIRMPGECAVVARVLEEFWSRHKDGGWVHERVQAELMIFAQRSTNAKKAARKRWGGNGKRRHAPALRGHSGRNAPGMQPMNHEPRTSAPPITNGRQTSEAASQAAADVAAANAARRERDGPPRPAPEPVKRTKADVAKIHEPEPLKHQHGMKPGNPACKCNACIAVRKLRDNPPTS